MCSGIALNSADADKLVALGGGDAEFTKWHVRSYRLGLERTMRQSSRRCGGPKKNSGSASFVAILCEIPPGGTASKLHTGIGLAQGRPAAGASLKQKAARLTNESAAP